MCCTLCGEKKWAVTVTPVADLIPGRMSILYPNQNLVKSYKTIALEGNKKDLHSCPRAHQVIFNELVEIDNQNGKELLIQIPQSFYVTYKSPHIKHNRYWSYKGNFVLLSKLKKMGINIDLFPKPISFSQKGKTKKQNIATLILPFSDQKTKKTYSVGTRFVRNKNKDTISHVGVWIFNVEKKRFITTYIPKKICLIKQPKTQEKKRKLLVHLLRKWIQVPGGFIPYVWGGCSFTHPYKKKMIKVALENTPKGSKWPIFSQINKNTPATGFDCAGAIARAAQIIEIPYFFKNSFTAAQKLSPVKTFQELKVGDLLYFPGHITVVSNIKENKIIEARNHKDGFGKLQEIELRKTFKGIKTYKQLFLAHKNKKFLHRLNSTGEVSETIKNVKLLKLFFHTS